jgi:hypothetical protein
LNEQIKTIESNEIEEEKVSKIRKYNTINILNIIPDLKIQVMILKCLQTTNKERKYIVFYVFFLLITNFCNSQTKLIYEGKYLDGFAKYEYFETNDYERIKQGSFLYNSTYGKVIIECNFNNNKLNDNWTFVYKGNTVHDKQFSYINGKYIGGKKNGLWTYKYNNPDKKIHNLSSFTFKNDTLIGEIVLDDFKIELDSLGNFNGLINFKGRSRSGYRTDLIIEFYKNHIIKYIEREEQDGSVLEKYTPNRDSIINFINNRNKNIISFNLSNKDRYCNCEIFGYEGKDYELIENVTYSYVVNFKENIQKKQSIAIGAGAFYDDFVSFVLKSPELLFFKKENE